MVDKLKAVNNAVKSLGDQRIGGYLAAFGSPNDSDLDGEWFSKDTNFELDWYSERPALYGHGMDRTHKTTAIGTIDKLEIREDAGLWAEAQLRDHFMYQDYIMKWLEQGKLGWSSGSSPYYADVGKDGFIRTWPIHEGSLTLKPAQPGKTTIRAVKHQTDVSLLHKAVKDLGLSDYNMDELMLHYESEIASSNDVANEASEDEPHETETKTVATEGRPITIINKVYAAPEPLNEDKSNTKDITMDATNTNVEEVEVQETTETAEVTSVTEATTTVVSQEAPPAGSQTSAETVTATPEVVKEVDDEYFLKMARERMQIFEVPVVQANLDDSVAKAKDWIRAKTFSPLVTEDIAEYARVNDEFQKFYNTLIKSYMPSEEDAAQAQANPEVEALKQQMAQMQQMMGQGGKSVLPSADTEQGSGLATKYHSFYQIDNMADKANYANYEFEDLAFYGYLRDYATRKGFANNPWRVNEQDDYYDALFHAGKDIVPQIQHLIPNPGWIDNDVKGEEIFAVKAFRHMGSAFKGKAIKANEVLSSGLDGRGAEWIYTLPDGSLWSILLSETGVMSSVPSFNMLSGSVDMYIDDETGYASLVPEIVTAEQTAAALARDNAANLLGNYAITPAGSQKVNFTARHVGQQTIISKIELEDARIDAARSARMHLEHALRRSIDWTIINAHATTGSVNYGHYGEETGGLHPEKQGLAGAGFDGLIARALTQTNDDHNAGYQAGAAPCVDFLTATRRLMDQRYYSNHSMIRMLMTPEDCDMLMDLEEFKRAAQYSGSWDGGAGMITSFQGTPIIKSEEVEKRNNDGQRSMTAADNDRGVIVMFRPDRCKLGIRRRLSRSMSEVGRYGEHLNLGASIRFDFQTIPNAVANDSNSGDYGSGLIRKPVSVAYDLS